MESRHFSHKHALVFHQVVQGSEIHCSGCKSAGSGNVYVCWQCSYFLHEHCFRSERSLKHPSHPLHPLTLMPSPTYPSGSFSCNSCNLDGDGFSYSCSECEFDIHVHCALNIPITNPNPHLFHSSVVCPGHKHTLTLYYSSRAAANREVTFTCDVCMSLIDEMAWVYYCRKCDFGTHLDCVTSEVKQQSASAHNIYPNNYNSQPLRSHPAHTHALSLSEIAKPTEDEYSNEKTCSGCEQKFTAGEEAYTCPERDCEFSLHKSCFDLPEELQRNSHHDHKLNLLLEPPYYSIYYECSACGEEIKGFSFRCDECTRFRLHVKCAFLPETVDSKAHEHTLVVRHDTPQPADRSGVMCEVCEREIEKEFWSYFCKDCNFVTDLQCAFTADAPPVKKEEKEEEDEEEEEEEKEEETEEYPEGTTEAEKLMIATINAQNRMAMIQLRLQLAKNNSYAVANMFRY
ncbi:hypothetical protein MIMGU_mgv1a019454mg [Erythranthe guttata]|uniref:DC1 domain-containing protein n=1 Tax=Erythranthe guttata TaxID=4155 RepID=A0A022QHS5_ERYGU|nr:hypothetical protein MIMGU_mgv1a019454mg [Erythranthe guttata]